MVRAYHESLVGMRYIDQDDHGEQLPKLEGGRAELGSSSKDKQPAIANVAQVYAVLIDEPYCLSFDQIAKLTDYQIFVLYLRERDKDGIPKKLEDPKLYREVKDRNAAKINFFTTGSMFGVPAHILQRQWAEQNGEL